MVVTFNEIGMEIIWCNPEEAVGIQQEVQLAQKYDPEEAVDYLDLATHLAIYLERGTQDLETLCGKDSKLAKRALNLVARSRHPHEQEKARLLLDELAASEAEALEDWYPEPAAA